MNNKRWNFVKKWLGEGSGTLVPPAPIAPTELNFILRESVQIRSFFWSRFSYIRTEYGNLRIQSVYRKIRTRKNSVFGHFSHNIDTFNLVLIKTHKWTRNDFTNVFIHIPCNKVWEYQNELSKIRNKSTVNSRTHG